MPLIGYLCAVVAGSFDLIAGWLTLQDYTKKVQPRYVMGFAAGLLLGVTFFHVLPEVNLEADTLLLALGFMVFYVLEKLMMIHACRESECEAHQVGPVAAVGMALDNVTDGAGIVVGYQIDPLLGLAVTLAVVLHEIPQGMTSALIMREANWSRKRMLLALAGAGLLYPAGALLAGLIPAGFQQKLLAFIAGDFIYIAAGDLLPEAHRRFNWKVVFLVIAGMLFAFLMKSVFP